MCSMYKMVMGRKYQKRRQYRKKKAGMRKRRGGAIRRLNTRSQGYMNLNRKLETLAILTGNEIGSVTSIDTTGTCITLGVPTLVSGALAGTYDVPFSLKFRLDQLSGYSELTALFDQYKINGVKANIAQFYNTSSVTSVGLPWLETFNDHDNSIPELLGQVRQRMYTKSTYYSATKQVAALYCKPKPSQAVYSNITSGIVPGASGRVNPWLDCSFPNVEHYSIKGIIHNMWLGNTGTNRFNIDVEMNVFLKGVI